MTHITELPGSHRELILRQRPRGLPRAADFEIVSRTLSPPAPGRILVRNRFTRISASVRMMLGADATRLSGIPFPPFDPGDTLTEETLGEVVLAELDTGLSVGDLVRHEHGFREYASPRPDECTRVDPTWTDPSAHLSHGWTAFAALTHGAGVSAGDTVFVSSGASAIGSMAGQIARLLGAGRVIGSTGSDAKAAFMIEELGYDAALVRGARPFTEALRAAAPDGIDVCIDTVGGEQLAAAIDNSREGARIVVMGALSGQLAPEGDGRTAPVALDSFPIIFRKITLRGFSADDVPETRAAWDQAFARWSGAGAIRFPRSIVRGLDGAMQGIEDACAGKFVGAVILEY